MPNSLPPITEWKRIFIDTSFIIDCITDAEKMTDDTRKLDCANARKLVDYLQKYNQDVTWITSSIGLSELTKFENEDLVGELQSLLHSEEVEIINFTRKEAKFIVKDMVKYVEEKHINQYLKRRKKELSLIGVFNPKGYVTTDARIIACAKSKPCDVVLTGDHNSFLKMAQKVKLPAITCSMLPLDLHEEIDFTQSIQY